jgi:hypothetical protein
MQEMAVLDILSHTAISGLLVYTERYKSLRIHTQRSACLTLYGSFKINDSKGEYAIYYDAVYRLIIAATILPKVHLINGVPFFSTDKGQIGHRIRI